MAGSQYAYVRNFELPDSVLPSVYMVVRIDGKGFHKFSEQHAFAKPNDERALKLMNAAALHVVESLRPDVTLAFGESDEYSFLLRKECTLYKRRQSKITTHIVSLFTSAYVFYWSQHMTGTTLQHPPSFDGRLVPYPGEKQVRDYFAWRQADTHINNLYNTTFWALVLQGGMSEREAHKALEGTVSSQKNDILFSRFGINYSKLPAIFRKGTTIAWNTVGEADVNGIAKAKKKADKLQACVLHVDIIGANFWTHEQSSGAAGAVATDRDDLSHDESATELSPSTARDPSRGSAGFGFRALR